MLRKTEVKNNILQVIQSREAEIFLCLSQFFYYNYFNIQTINHILYKDLNKRFYLEYELFDDEFVGLLILN